MPDPRPDPSQAELTAPDDFEALKDRITGRYGALSGQLKRIAEFALDHPDDLALATVTSAAERLGVQPSSMVRFAKAFGYDGFSDLQQIFRLRLIAAAPSYRDRIRSLDGAAEEPETTEALLQAFADQGLAALALLRDHTPADRVESAIEILAAAGTQFVLAQRRAFPVAVYLAYALGRLERRCLLLDGAGGLLAQQAAQAGPADAMIAVSFKPYAPEVAEIVAQRAAAGVPVIAITDSALSPIARDATLSFEIQEPGEQGFRTLVAPILLAQVLVVGLGRRLSRQLSEPIQ